MVSRLAGGDIFLSLKQLFKQFPHFLLSENQESDFTNEGKLQHSA